MTKHFLFFCLVLLFSSCNTVDNEDRLEGYFAKDPIVNFKRYYLKTYRGVTYPELQNIATIESPDTLAFLAVEFNRADGKPCPAKGSELSFTIETMGGDKEKFYLDDYSDWIELADNVTPYLKILKYTFYHSGNVIPAKNNQIIEINEGGDKIIATYWSYWHQHVVKDTLIIAKSS